MNLKSYLSLGAASVAVLASAGVANAASLAPGELSLVLDTGIFFTGNVIDFSPVAGGGRSLGTPGLFTVTTTDFNDQAGIFADDPLAGGGNRTFIPDTFPTPGGPIPLPNGQINDLAFPKAAADALAGGGVQDGVSYDFDSDFGVASEFALLDFDTDQDGSFGEGDDFQYFATSFTRTSSESPSGGFNVTLDFEGFFRDNAGVFDDTPSVISIINGTTTSDPTAFPNVLLADFANPALAGNGSGSDTGSDGEPFEVGFTASFDATITTELKAVPEPTAVMGLLSVFGLAGGLLKRKKA